MTIQSRIKRRQLSNPTHHILTPHTQQLHHPLIRKRLHPLTIFLLPSRPVHRHEILLVVTLRTPTLSHRHVLVTDIYHTTPQTLLVSLAHQVCQLLLYLLDCVHLPLLLTHLQGNLLRFYLLTTSVSFVLLLAPVPGLVERFRFRIR